MQVRALPCQFRGYGEIGITQRSQCCIRGSNPLSSIMDDEKYNVEDAPDEDYCESCGAYGPLEHLRKSLYNDEMLCGTCKGEEDGHYGHRWLKVKSLLRRRKRET